MSRRPEIVIAAVTLAAHSLIAVMHGGPVALPDVSAYLGYAQYLHGGQIVDPTPFFPGYGLLLSSFGGLPGSQMHTIALIGNGLAASTIVLMAAVFARRHGASQGLSLFCALLAAVHPAVSASSRIAWPETWLILLVFIICELIGYRSNRALVGAALLSGLALSMHPRAIVIVAGLLATTILSRRLKPILLGIVFSLALISVALSLTNSWPMGRVSAATNNLAESNPLATVGGQLLALSAGTCGFALLGLIYAVTSSIKAVNRKTNQRYNANASELLFLSVSSLGMIFLGGWVLMGSIREDTLMYGRYIDLWSLPLAYIGIIAVVKKKTQRSTTLVALVLIFVTSVTSIAAVGAVSESYRIIMVQSLSSLWRLDLPLVLTIVISGLLSASAVLTARRPSQSVIAVSLAAFTLLCVASTTINQTHLSGVGQISDGQSITAARLPKTETCLSHDESVDRSYPLWLYRLELPRLEHLRIDLQSGEKPCGAYVIAESSIQDICRNIELVEREPRGSWSLWRYPTLGCS